MPNTEGTLKRRNKGLQVAEVESSAQNKENMEEVEKNVRKTLKYYWNRFRYYHYCIAEKLDNLIGIVCCAMLRIIIFFIGWQKQEDELTNMLDMDND